MKKSTDLTLKDLLNFKEDETSLKNRKRFKKIPTVKINLSPCKLAHKNGDSMIIPGYHPMRPSTYSKSGRSHG